VGKGIQFKLRVAAATAALALPLAVPAAGHAGLTHDAHMHRGGRHASATLLRHRRKPRRQRHTTVRRAQTLQPCTAADTPITAASAATMRAAVLCLVNQQRALHSLPALHESRLLDTSAQVWADTMVATGLFSHGTNFTSRIDATGYFWSDVGENIATGFTTPRAAVRAWMASAGHCENILDPTFADVGTGVQTHPLGNYSAGTWTQDFGLLMGQSDPSQNTGPARGCPYSI
jgi:uncharacterized protein YkwD